MKIRITTLLLPFFLMLALGGCGAATETPSDEAATVAEEAATAAISGPAEQAATPLTGCVSLREWQAAGYGTLDVKIIPWKEENAIVPDQYLWAVQFGLTRDGKTYQAEIAPPYFDPSTIVLDEEDIPVWAQVCLDHVFIANLPAERGGHLIVANQLQDKLIMTQYPYSSGDEDTTQVRFINGAINVANSAQLDAPGWNLVEDTDPEAVAPHAYVPEQVRCEASDDVGHTAVWLSVDAVGDVYALEYLSIMDSGTSCSVDAARDDAREADYSKTTWSGDSNRTNVVWDDGEEYPSTLIITRADDLYTVDAQRLLNSQFCGQSSQLAWEIKLRRGSSTCEHVQWPDY